MKVIVMNRQALIDERLKNEHADRIQAFDGDMKESLSATVSRPYGREIIVKMTNGNYAESAGKAKLEAEVKALQKRAQTAINAAQAPSGAIIAALVERIFIDMTRRYQESPDFTSRIVTEVNNPDFPDPVNMREILEYRGQMETISGANDSVPLIEQALAEVDTLSLEMKAIGWKTSLRNIIFNPFHNMQKVLDAVTMAYTDYRNAAVIGTIVGTAFDASQQAPAGVGGATYETDLYITFRNAIQLLRTLLDNNTNRPISVPSISLLCNSADTWYIERAINGQLAVGGGDAVRGVNNTALPISEVIEYDRGGNDGFAWGLKEMDFPGVTQGTCYLFVPRVYAWAAIKRGLMMEVGTGSVLQLSQEERAWYCVQGVYLKDFLGSSFSGVDTSGYGAIVEVTLPEADT